MLERAAETVELRDDELVVGTRSGQQRLVELGARGEFAACLVDEDLVAARRRERVMLAIGPSSQGRSPNAGRGVPGVPIAPLALAAAWRR
jgi:hypothetical protein